MPIVIFIIRYFRAAFQVLFSCWLFCWLFSCFSEKFYKNRWMRRFKFAGHKVYHGGNSSNIITSPAPLPGGILAQNTA